METRSRATKKVIPVIVKEVEVHEAESNMYKDYSALQISFDKLRRHEEEIQRLIDLNTEELSKYRSLYYKNKKNFNKCKGKDNNCSKCRDISRDISVTWHDIGRCNSYIYQCKKCKSFYLRELCSDSWGENYTYQDV